MNSLAPHHIGIATRSIEAELGLFKFLGFVEEEEFIDENQGVRGLFLISSFEGDRSRNVAKDCLAPTTWRIELLENLPHSARLDSYLKTHHKLYHLAFETKNLEKDSKRILDARWDGPKSPLSSFSNALEVEGSVAGFINSPKNPKSPSRAIAIDENRSSKPRFDSRPRATKARMLISPVEASCFARLCFIMLPNRLLIELVELRRDYA